VGDIHIIQTVCAVSSHIQTLPFRVVLEASHHDLSIGVAHVHRGAMVGLQRFFFLLPFLSLFFMLKYKSFLFFNPNLFLLF
jgi:hypothetical protein